MQVALIDASISHSSGAPAGPDVVGGVGGCSCLLLLHSTPTCVDAGPERLQLVLVVFAFRQLLQILHLH